MTFRGEPQYSKSCIVPLHTPHDNLNTLAASFTSKRFWEPHDWSQVWFPVLVSILTLVVVLLTRKPKPHDLEFKY